MIAPELRAQIRRLFYGEHWRVGTIAAQLGVHHETVESVIGVDAFVSRGAFRKSGVDPYVPFIGQTLERYPKLTATRVYDMVRQRGYKGTAVQVRRRIRQLGLRPRAHSEAFQRLRLLPGEQGQADWAHVGRLRVLGTWRPLYAFVIVLSYSRAFHVHFAHDQSAASVMRAHIEAFEEFGGVPREMLYDNMKTAVIERVGDAARFHARLLELAMHYCFEPKLCKPRRPQEKGRVERRIRDLRASFFAAREFSSLEDASTQFRAWRDEVGWTRPCPDEPTKTIAEALEEERPRLRPLPEHPLVPEDVRDVLARKQPYVRVDTNLYSIPHTLVGVPLTLCVGARRVRVLHETKVVAEHARSWGRGAVIEAPGHLEGLVASRPGGAPAAGRAHLLDLVPAAAGLYEALASRGEPMGPQTASLLRLLDRHGAAALAEAITEAIERGTPRAASVERLLAARHKTEVPALPLPLDEKLSSIRIKDHNLEDYDDLANPRRPV